MAGDEIADREPPPGKTLDTAKPPMKPIERTMMLSATARMTLVELFMDVYRFRFTARRGRGV